MTGVLRLACIDADAPPLFGLADGAGVRQGFEPAVAELIAVSTITEASYETQVLKRYRATPGAAGVSGLTEI